LVGEKTAKYHTAFVECIKDIFVNKMPPCITELYKEKYKAKNVPNIDVERTNMLIKDLGDMVVLERIFGCMESVVTVCIVQRKDLAPVCEMIMNWIGVIATSHTIKMQLDDVAKVLKKAGK
jgi:hypothetical protein